MRASPDPNAANQAKVAVTLGELDVGPLVHEVRTAEPEPGRQRNSQDLWMGCSRNLLIAS